MPEPDRPPDDPLARRVAGVVLLGCAILGLLVVLPTVGPSVGDARVAFGITVAILIPVVVGGYLLGSSFRRRSG